jgi:hypothetical protein
MARAAKKPPKSTTAKATAKPRKPATKPPAAPARRPGPRADYGAPIDAFFLKQPPHLREILDALRALVEAAAPEATAALKWGMPVYAINGKMAFVLGGHKAHVNLVLSGPPAIFPDPDGLLSGEAQGGRRLVLRTLAELPRAAVTRWVKAAAKHARGGA